VIVAGLFAPERRELLTLLRGLSHEAWGRPTACEGWSVKDVTAHILRDDLGNLSGGRDGHAAGHIDAATLEARITCRGDQALGRHLLGAVAIIASMPAGA
jgi:uncharacterized protein (TIGR03083 family)